MKKNLQKVVIGATAGALAVATFAIVTPASAAPTKGVIQVGAVCDTTGPVQFPESCAAAKAYLDKINAAGGINGYTFNYNQADGGGSAATTATAVQRLINSNGVQVFVGGSGTNVCTAGSALMKAKGIYDIEGFAADDGCWASSNAMPMNTGGTLGYIAVLNSLFTMRNKAKVCTMIPNTPTIGNARRVIAAYEKSTGNKIAAELLWNPGGDLTPMVASAKANGCTAVGLIGIEPVYVGVLRTAQAQQAFTAGDSTAFSTGYTSSLVTALGSLGEGLMASSEFLPWSSTNPALKEFLALQKSAGFSLSSQAEGGYLAAKIFVDRVKTITGPVNAASIGKALATSSNVSTYGMTAKPFTWGVFNVSSQYVQIKGGKWAVPYAKWYTPNLTNAQVKALVTGQG